MSQRFALTTTKKGHSLKVCPSPVLLFVVLHSYRWVTVWAIVYKYRSAAFSWITFSCFMEPSQTAEHQFYLCLWLKVWPAVLKINCTSNSCWAVTQVWAWATGSQPGLLPTGTELGDGKEQEGEGFWGVLLDPAAAQEWAPPQESGVATGQGRNLCRRDRLFTQKVFRQW